VVMISGHGNIDMAVRAVKGGAFDFLEKPLSLEKILTVCRNALALGTLRRENLRLKESLSGRNRLVGSSPAMEEIREAIRLAAASEARILISGENGTGKEVVARAIHEGSARSGGPFVEVNCAAIPDSLIESELFGHEKGAFTDAVSLRKGRFEAASGGTLFLDEIGDMSLAAQAKVLRVIQEQKLQRVGGDKVIETDVRIIAATNMDLEAACTEGRFRRDLFFRLNVIPVHIPPLRMRLSDIPLLLDHFLADFGLEGADLGADGLGAEGLALLAAHPWPGNVRELKNLAERISVMHRSGPPGPEALARLLKMGSPVPETAALPGKTAASGDDSGPLPREMLELGYQEAKEEFDRRYLRFQFERNGGIIARTAEAIGMYPSNLHAKLRKFGIGAGDQAKKEGPPQ
ncbi:MAG: sigma-54 dependent transcriptional regulator, partial [Treponema sp.]|nr:sigma-54 dependent transcriptional regulator [Treponema sp.]